MDIVVVLGYDRLLFFALGHSNVVLGPGLSSVSNMYI